MSIQFTASNQRTTAVWLELDGVAGASGAGRLSSGATRQIQSQAGDVWVAHRSSALNGIIGVYEATDRVPTWNILESSTGLPEELERFNNGFYSESLGRLKEFLRPDQVLKTIFLFVDFSDAPAAGASWSDEARIIQRISGGADRWLQDTSFGQSGLTVAHQAGWRRMPKPATAYSDALCRCLSGSAREYLEDVAVLFADVDFSLYDFLCVVAAKTDQLDLSPAWSGLPPEGPIPTANDPISHAITFGADSYDPKTDHRLLLHEALHLCGLPDLYDGGSIDGAGKANFSSKLVGPWDLMADHRETHHLLGWHRLKLGWLHPSQVLTHFGGGKLEVELTGWTKEDGIHCVMVPLQPTPIEIGNSEIDVHNAKASKAYLIEPAPGGGGVLVYSVDASVPTWESPIQIRGDKSDVRLPGLLQPSKTYRHLSSGLAVEVLQETQDGCRVAISTG